MGRRRKLAGHVARKKKNQWEKKKGGKRRATLNLWKKRKSGLAKARNDIWTLKESTDSGRRYLRVHGVLLQKDPEILTNREVFRSFQGKSLVRERKKPYTDRNKRETKEIPGAALHSKTRHHGRQLRVLRKNETGKSRGKSRNELLVPRPPAWELITLSMRKKKHHAACAGTRSSGGLRKEGLGEKQGRTP